MSGIKTGNLDEPDEKLTFDHGRGRLGRARRSNSRKDNRRAGVALVHAHPTAAYVKRVSKRKVDDLVRALGIDGISKSDVRRAAAQMMASLSQLRASRHTESTAAS